MSDPQNPKKILLVEDNEDDVFFMRRVLKKAEIFLPLAVVTDGKMALDYLTGEGKYQDRSTYPLPDLIFLDLKLPFFHGFEVLEWIRKQPSLQSIHVVVLSSSLEDQDRDRALALSAPYLVKPPNAALLLQVIESLRA